jgi:hypothetical protein
MTTLIPIVTEFLKRYFPKLDSRAAAVIVMGVFVGVFFLLGANTVELFFSVVTALASYGILWKPMVFQPLMGKRRK